MLEVPVSSFGHATQQILVIFTPQAHGAGTDLAGGESAHIWDDFADTRFTLVGLAVAQ